MADPNLIDIKIDIELVYHDQNDRPCLKAFKLPLGISLGEALRQVRQRAELSGLASHSAVSLEGRLGIFGKILPLKTLLNAGDRIEIYRDLVIDPKEARRGRASLKAQALREAWLAKKRAKKWLSPLDPSVEDVHL